MPYDAANTMPISRAAAASHFDALESTECFGLAALSFSLILAGHHMMPRDICADAGRQEMMISGFSPSADFAMMA